MKAPDPIASFKVYPAIPSRLFFRVKVFQNVQGMHAYVRTRPMPSRPGRFCKGIVSIWTVIKVAPGKGQRTTPEMGEIVLCRHWLGSELLSHESSHAALGWARRVGVKTDHPSQGGSVTSDEERFCYALGKIMRGIVVGLYANELLK